MRERTEDLLSLRDGEPVDAALRDRVSRSAEAVAELEELAVMRERLRHLPACRVPPGAWGRIESALGASPEAAGQRTRARKRMAGLAAAAVLAVVGAAVFLVVDGLSEEVPRVVMNEPRAPQSVPTPTPADSGIGELVSQSARLEGLLRRLPPQRRLVEVRTVSTIVGLEQQIALIDMQLTLGAAAGAEPELRETLWEDRVELMNALVHIRYTRSQPFVY